VGTRVFVWLGGVLFVVSLMYCAWWYTVALAAPMPGPAWPALAFDACLITTFALHHSLFAREGIKTRVARALSPRLVRTLYVWIASVLLILVCWWWQPVGGVAFRSSGAIAALHVTVQLCGVWLIVQAVRGIDALELAGIRPEGERAGALQTTGVYGWVRHPLYSGWVLVAFGAAQMTGDRLAFAAITTTYLLLAMPWEERSLMRSFGDAYARYARAVRWRIIPFIY
jgi:protein-S-isoprenylcysteine O-methyltransferase Ste14